MLGNPVLNVLIVEDDPESLKLLVESLDTTIGGHQLCWDPCSSFDEGIAKIGRSRYDLVLTDVYRDRHGIAKGDMTSTDAQAENIVDTIRKTRFLPVVLFSDGSKPEKVTLGPFVKFADKSKGNDEIMAALKELISTGIPQVARQLHDDLDKFAGSYLWGFLEQNWTELQEKGVAEQRILERLVRKRAAVQLSRLNPAAAEPSELACVDPVEFYICPPISLAELRCGEILKGVNSDDYWVLLTPSCHSAIQPGDQGPRADRVLLAKALPAGEVIAAASKGKPAWSGDDNAKQDKLRRRIKSPAELGRPAGRYWFLPNFLNVPDLYCDFMNLNSVESTAIASGYRRVAVLDTPYAEALQSCFTGFYSTIGIPALALDRFQHLIG